MNQNQNIKRLIQTDEYNKLQEIGLNLHDHSNQFNIIDLFERMIDENAWSKILTYLLNSKNNHDLGQLFFRTWIKRINNKELDVFLKELPDIENSEIKTIAEWKTNAGRRIDILILITDNANQTHSVIGIENKLFSAEGYAQLSDYQRAINETFHCKNKILIYLTPTGKESQTSKHNYECPCIDIGYKTIGTTCQELIKIQPKHQVRLLLQGIDLYFQKILKENEMETEINQLIKKLYADPQHRQAIKLLASNLPTITSVFNRLSEDYSKNDLFTPELFKGNEFKLYANELGEIMKKENVGLRFCYMLKYHGNTADIGDLFVLRLMLLIQDNSVANDIHRIRDYFRLPNSINEDREWWKWKTIWTGDSYQIKDLAEEDYEGLKNLMQASIDKTYNDLKDKVSNYFRSSK